MLREDGEKNLSDTYKHHLMVRDPWRYYTDMIKKKNKSTETKVQSLLSHLTHKQEKIQWHHDGKVIQWQKCFTRGTT